MSDPTSHDEARPPVPDSLDAARKLAELLARPLEPVARPPEPPGEPGATPLTVRRDAEYRLAEAATRPAQSAPPEPAPPEPAPPELAPPQPTPSAEPPAADLAAPPLPAEGTEAPAVPPAARSVILARFADAMARLVDEAKVPGGRPETLDGGGESQPDPTAPADDAGDDIPPFVGPPEAPVAAEALPSPPLPSPQPAEPPLGESVGPAAVDRPPPDPEAERLVRRVRRMMLISSLTTVIAAGAVFGVIGYRVFKSAEAPPSAPVAAPQPPEPPAPPPPPQVPLEATLTLPKDARIVYTAVAEDLLVLSLEINGTIEIRTYDLKTLKPAGRMSFGEVP